MSALLKEGNVTAQDHNSKGETALHWAAMNNRLNACKLLVENGAAVDAKGGELGATPLQWACRYGLVYIVHYLIQQGADPLRTDSQGYDALQLAVHSSNVMLVIYLLHQNLPVDPVDAHDRTPLHWAAYQSDGLTVHVLLSWGADPNKRDELGFTPLHWALTRGDKIILKRLIEEGTDVYAETNDGKTPWQMAKEMNCVGNWRMALNQAGRLPDGSIRRIYFSKKVTDLIIFFTPYLVLGFNFKILSSLYLILDLILIPIVLIATLFCLNTYVLPNAYHGSTALSFSPFLAGVFSGSVFWVIIDYFFIIFPSTWVNYKLLNVILPFLITSLIYFFFKCMLMDPGYVPKLSGITEQKQVIEELIDIGKYDAKNFCIHTLVRKPLRARFSRKSKKVIAKFDHYCPWVNNEIGIRNHRPFLAFLVSLVVAIPVYTTLVFYHFHGLENDQDDLLECGFIGQDLCRGFVHSRFSLFIAAWASLQFIWVILLVFVQLIQIARGLTTFEATALHRFGDQMVFSSAPSEVLAANDSNHPSLNIPDTLPPIHNSGCSGSITRLLGLDQFVATAKDVVQLSKQAQEGSRHRKRPGDYGVIKNCGDFWCPFGKISDIIYEPSQGHNALGGQVVDYYKLYEYPDTRSIPTSSGYIPVSDEV